jgi:hypothetical protein
VKTLCVSDLFEPVLLCQICLNPVSDLFELFEPVLLCQIWFEPVFCFGPSLMAMRHVPTHLFHFSHFDALGVNWNSPYLVRRHRLRDVTLMHTIRDGTQVRVAVQSLCDAQDRRWCSVV